MLLAKLADCRKLAEGHSVLKLLLENYNITHVSYFVVNMPSAKLKSPRIASTYSADWQRHYIQSGYVNLDPAISAVVMSLMPVNWSSLDLKNPFVKKFFGEAQEFKIGKQGISIPVRGSMGEFAMLSVSSDMSPHEWQIHLNNFLPHLINITYHFHNWVVRREGNMTLDERRKLTIRERQCLMWRAQGKSDRDTADLLNLKVSTVKFHMENVRIKLEAVNTDHAIALSVSMGLISSFSNTFIP